MTVTATVTKDTYTGTGANTPLATTFTFDAASDIEVVKRVTSSGEETVLVLTTNYTVTGGNGSTGTVTPVDGATDFPATVTWTIRRKTALSQSTDYIEADDFPAESHEDALDRLTRIVQELDERINRCIQIPRSESGTVELVSSVDRADGTFAFDSSGDPSIVVSSLPTASVSGFMTPLLLSASGQAFLAGVGITYAALASPPGAPSTNDLHITTDTKQIRRWTGAAWEDLIGDGASIVNPEAVDDHGATEAEFAGVRSPGSLATAVILPSGLDEELEMLRWTLKSISGAVNAKRTGSNAVLWHEGHIVGPNLMRNGAFLDYKAAAASAPLGWTLNGAATVDTQTALSATEGVGFSMRFQAAAGGDYLQQAMAGLKGSTLYRVEARVKPTTNAMSLRTSGAAAGNFADINLTSASGTGTWETLIGYVITDASGTTINVRLQAEAAASDFECAHVSFHEIDRLNHGSRNQELTQYATSNSTDEATIESALQLSIVPPGPGYVIEVECGIYSGWSTVTGNGDILVEIQEEGVTVAQGSADRHGSSTAIDVGYDIPVMAKYVNESPVPGTKLTYSVLLTATGNWSYEADDHYLTVRLRKE